MFRVKHDASLGSYDDLAVTVTGTKEETVELFHAANRMLSLIDDVVKGGSGLDPSDEMAYDRLNQFLAALQAALSIDPNDS